MGLGPEPHSCAPGEQLQPTCHEGRPDSRRTVRMGRQDGWLVMGKTDGWMDFCNCTKWVVTIVACVDDRHTVEREALLLCTEISKDASIRSPPHSPTSHCRLTPCIVP